MRIGQFTARGAGVLLASLATTLACLAGGPSATAFQRDAELPDTFVQPEILRLASTYVFQHMDQDAAKTLQDMQEIGGRYFYASTADPLNDQTLTWVDAARRRGLTPIVGVGVKRGLLLGVTDAQVRELGARVAERFRGKVSWYDVNGEVNNTWFDNRDPEVSPRRTVERVRAFSEGVRSKDPTARISLMQLGSSRPEEYLRECARLGLARWTDAWGHGYEYSPGKFNDPKTTLTRFRENQRLAELAAEEGRRAGHPISYQEQGMMRSAGDSMAQAKVIALKTVVNQGAGIVLNEWYKLYDPSGQNFRLVAPDLTSRFAGFHTLKHLNRFLDPRRYAPISRTLNSTPDGLFWLAFKASDEDVVIAVWDPARAPTDTLGRGRREDVSLPDYGLTPSEVLDPITGRSTGRSLRADARGGKLILRDLEVADYPRLIRFVAR